VFVLWTRGGLQLDCDLFRTPTRFQWECSYSFNLYSTYARPHDSCSGILDG
jgi:hypothetical protein